MISHVRTTASISTGSEIDVILKRLVDSRDQDSAQASGTALVSVLAKDLPVFAGDFLQELKKCVEGPAWKRESAAGVAEYLTRRLFEPANPVSRGLKTASSRLRQLLREKRSWFTTGVGVLSHLFALIVFAILWPYGQIFKASLAALQAGEVARSNATFRARDGIERFPFLIEAGTCYIIWFLLTAVSVPFIVLIGSRNFLAS